MSISIGQQLSVLIDFEVFNLIDPIPPCVMFQVELALGFVQLRIPKKHRIE